MTIIEASIKLIDWFQKNDFFYLEKNFKDVVFITENREADKAALLCGLKKLEKMNIVSEGCANGDAIFVLEKPLESMDQTVTVSSSTAKEVAMIINIACEKADVPSDFCDFADLREKDIKNLIVILHSLMEDKKD